MSKTIAPRFEWRLLLPKFWLIWLGVLVLYLISWLPLPILRVLAKGNAWLLKKLAKKRVAVARRNLALTWPKMTDSEREALLAKHLDCAGMAIFETALGWWAPAWRIRRIGKVEGFEHVEAVLKHVSYPHLNLPPSELV